MDDSTISSKQETNWVTKLAHHIRNAPPEITDQHEGQKWRKRSIYKLPEYYMEQNKNAYQPQVVSFGPYHNGEAHLMPMEEHKFRALVHFFNIRSKKPLEIVAESLREVTQDLKDSYHPLGSKWRDDDKFLELMILDGCFMLEILYSTLYNNGLDDEVKGYDIGDPIFSRHGALYIMSNIRRDMMMLENQLPMLLLKKLHALARGYDDVNEHAEYFMNKLIQKTWFLDTLNPHYLGKCLHVLDVLRKSQIPQPQYRSRIKERIRRRVGDLYDKNFMRSATELTEAGIEFKKSKTSSLRDISFDNNGYLSLPVITVDNAIESNLLNMIAFERLHVEAGNEVTTYAILMDNLIDNEKDIALLRHVGIIQNALANDKVASDMFNSIANDATLDPDSSISLVMRDVNWYCNRRRSRWRAIFYHTYGRSPLAVIAACLLFVLSVIQTLYAIVAYHAK